jgi:hypothetical protein
MSTEDPTDTVADSSEMGLHWQVRTATVAERQAAGSAARTARSRSSMASFVPSPDRPDPVGLLAGQETARVQPLLPCATAGCP